MEAIIMNLFKSAVLAAALPFFTLLSFSVLTGCEVGSEDPADTVLMKEGSLTSSQISPTSSRLASMQDLVKAFEQSQNSDMSFKL